jgi:hypothetical protein
MWEYFEPEEALWYRWRLDGAEAYLRKNGDEWRTIFVPARFQDLVSQTEGPEAAEPPTELQSSFTVARSAAVALRPRMSEMPYLVVARNDIRFSGGAEARFDVALPVVFRFELPGGEGIAEAMPYLLSNTWFGDKAGGSLCWSLPTALDPICQGEVGEAGACVPFNDCRSLVRCEIVVRNDSKMPLDLKRLAVYTELLNIYEEDGHLVTDPVRVDGLADGLLRMSVADSPPVDGRKLLTPARVGQREMFVRRGVNFLRSVTGM